MAQVDSNTGPKSTFLNHLVRHRTLSKTLVEAATSLVNFYHEKLPYAGTSIWCGCRHHIWLSKHMLYMAICNAWVGLLARCWCCSLSIWKDRCRIKRGRDNQRRRVLSVNIACKHNSVNWYRVSRHMRVCMGICNLYIAINYSYSKVGTWILWTWLWMVLYSPYMAEEFDRQSE